ncbi:MAG: geranylgeranyl reductase family protein [Desulfovibrio sp.]|nr:geranylgeranyl reductase family protein [Desulfovibrio sp.]
MVKDYDVLVAGAGPAGSAAACVLAGRGFRVGLVDRAAYPRPKLCGGLLTAKSMEALRRIFGLSEADLAARGGLFHQTPDYVFLHRGRELLRGAAAEPFRFIDRPAFDALLASAALARGAELLPGREVASCDPERGVLTLGDGTRLSASFVIGADGANSATRRALNIDREAWKAGLAAAIEVELPVGRGPGEFPRAVRTPELHVGAPDVPAAGYGWVFPGPRGPKVGICGLRRNEARQGRDFAEIFRGYLRLLGVQGAEGVPLRGHPLPYGNALARPCLGRLLLAGDAAGFVEPLFGEGIFYSMATGAHAATAVCRALEQGADAAAQYEGLLARTVRPEFLWSDRLRWVLFAALQRFGALPIKGFVKSAPAALAQMVHGGRSFRLLASKRWEWGDELEPKRPG